MIRFPGTHTAESFLASHWQKQALFLPNAVAGDFPSLTQDELGWLATLDDVESRIVFTERSGARLRYSLTNGPFDESWLQQLPDRDWTLLVHDVEKHLPEMRRLFDSVSFVPDWRIDDLMVSFAAPGGGVGPHRDNYDVFLLQGSGQRDWTISAAEIGADPEASDDLALLQPFSGESYACNKGDVLYLPPNLAHWGTASSGCMTYSIGMRAPQRSELLTPLPDTAGFDPFYSDRDLGIDEVVPGYISLQAMQRASDLVGDDIKPSTLGRCVTSTKDWLRPECADESECDALIHTLEKGGVMPIHGMARIAWDDENVYTNGAYLEVDADVSQLMAGLCRDRRLAGTTGRTAAEANVIRWLLLQGAFELPENT